MAKTFFFMGKSGQRSGKVRAYKRRKTTVLTVGQRKIEKQVDCS